MSSRAPPRAIRGAYSAHPHFPAGFKAEDLIEAEKRTGGARTGVDWNKNIKIWQIRSGLEQKIQFTTYACTLRVVKIGLSE